MKLTDSYFWQTKGRKIEAIAPIAAGVLSCALIQGELLFYPIAFAGYTALHFSSKAIANKFFIKKIANLSPNEKLAYLEKNYNEVSSLIVADKDKPKQRQLLEKLQNEITSLKIHLDIPTEEQAQIPKKLPIFELSYRRINELSQALPKDKYGGNMLFCKTLLKKLQNMVALQEENTETANYATKIFELYIPEIINICENIPHKKAEGYVDYMKNLNKVLSQLDKLTDATTEKIINYTDMDAEASFNVLIREMENDKKNMQ